uniref:HAD family hydrolase n=1 Tax=Thaumasiovibrio occultus TaxID=1891184 RepID=UPI000B350560|nr:HAD-IA family hydrolase [Thaumasiovibrio occultus]
MVDALLFDLDGTLLDTAPDMGAAANAVLADHGHAPLTHAQIQANTSYGARGLLKAGFGDDLVNHDPQQLRQAFLDYYAKDICIGTAYYPEIETVLTTLHEQAIPWGIMTNKPGFLTELLLPYFPLLRRANIICCGDTLPFAKPHPEPLLHCAKIMAVEPDKIAYIGDIEGDMIAAKNASMQGIIAGWGYVGDPAMLTNWPARKTLTTPAQILGLVTTS